METVGDDQATEADEVVCDHDDFIGEMNFTRLREGDGNVIDYTVDISAKCGRCGKSVHWVGLAGGYSPAEPRVNANGTEMRAPFAMVAGIVRSGDQASVMQRVEVEIVRAKRPEGQEACGGGETS